MPGGFSWSAGLCHAVLVRHQGRDAQGRADLEFRCRACVGQAGDPGRSGMVARAARGPDREPGEGPRPALARGGRAGRFHRRADARHRGRRDSHRAYRRQVESQPEPHPADRQGVAQGLAEEATRSWRDWWRGAADWAETSHPRVASAGLRPFRATVTRSVARRCARRRARPAPGQAAYRGRLQQRGGGREAQRLLPGLL